MNAGLWEQSLRRNFQTNATFLKLKCVSLAFSAFQRSHTSIYSILHLSIFRIVDHPGACITCCLWSLLWRILGHFFQIKEKDPGEQEGSSHLCVEPLLTQTALLLQPQSTSFDVIAVCNIRCCCGHNKLPRSGAMKNWEGMACFQMHLTPVFTREETAFISMLLDRVECGCYWEMVYNVTAPLSPACFLYSHLKSISASRNSPGNTVFYKP